MLLPGTTMASMTSRTTLSATCCLAWTLVWPATPGPRESGPALYRLTTETGMPHLEENLRYTTTHSLRCLDRAALFTAFPILAHPALQGCRLTNPAPQDDLVRYNLTCDGTHGTTGQAIWRIDGQQLRGTLNVKLGGKNMTFYQRITAVYQGSCKG